MGLHGGLLLVVLLSAVVPNTADGSGRSLATAAVVPAVVGGRDAQRNRFAYYASLREALSNYHYCGATLVAPRFLLTAAHCVTEYATTQAIQWSAPHRAFPRARVGAYETYPVPAVPGANSFEQRQVIAVAVHRLFDFALNNDIALLLLDRPATRATIMLPTAAAQLQQRAPVGSRLLSIGFGLSEFSDEVDSMPAEAYEPVLQQLWMLRQPHTGGSFVKAGNPPRYLTDTWKGDSGGPLLLPNATDPSRDMQFGIVSNGWYGQPAYYTDVSRFVAWITRGQQLLLNPTGQDAASYHITRLPACASTTNRYCAYCSAQGERLTCVDRTPCHITFQGQTQLLLLCSDPEFEAGPMASSGCFRAMQHVDRSGYGQGPGILGNKTFALQAALGARLPNDTFPACPAPAPYVLKACPGAPSSLACVPGSRPLTGLESGCCACRRTQPTVPYTLVYPATPVANTYYETVPDCRKAVRALLGGTIVHYTGALVRGNPWLGCAQKKYAKVVLEMLSASGTGVSHAAFYVQADKLVHCGAKTCIELGGNCQDAPTSCCTLASDGGAPTARCVYPPDVVPSSACAAQ